MKLKIEPCLKFDDASRQCTLRATEVRIIDSRREKSKRREVQVIKSVKEIRLDLKKCPLTKKRGQTSSLPQAHVNGEISRTTERVAPNSGGQQPVGVVFIEVMQSAAGKISTGPDKRVIVSIGERAAKVSRRTRRTNEVVGVCGTHTLSGVRRPRKTGVPCQYAVDLPATKRFAHKVLAVAKQRQVP